jgi:hypothetical protein
MYKEFKRMYLYMLVRRSYYRFNKDRGILEYGSTSGYWQTSVFSDDIISLIGGPNALI